MLSNGQVGWVSLGGQCGIKWAKDILTGRIPDRWCVVDGWGTMVIKEWEWHCENNEEEYKNKTWKGFRCETLFQMDVGWIPLVLLKVKYMFFILFMRRDKREQVTKRRGWSLLLNFLWWSDREMTSMMLSRTVTDCNYMVMYGISPCYGMESK